MQYIIDNNYSFFLVLKTDATIYSKQPATYMTSTTMTQAPLNIIEI